MQGLTHLADRFTRIPGKERNYYDSNTGKIYSRRQYDKLSEKERRAPAKSSERKKHEASQLKKYQSAIGARVVKLRSEGKEVSVRAVRNAEETKTLYKELKASNAGRTKYVRGKKKGHDKPRTAAENKKLIRILKDLGRREGIPDWVKPGETAAFKRGGLSRK